MATATSEVNLIRNVRSAWRSTSSETLDNPMCGMPKLMRVSPENPGDYINILTKIQPFFVFLILQAIEGLINFGTPCIKGGKK